MSREEKLELLATIESCSGASRLEEEGCTENGKLSLKEILACIEQEKCRRFLLDDMPESLACLANEDLVREAFLHRDKDGDGLLDKDEWLDYLNDLENLHRTYLLVNAFRQFRAFFGRGQSYMPGSMALEQDSSSNHMDKESLEAIVRPLLKQDQEALLIQQEEGLLVQGLSFPCFQLGLDPEWASCRGDFLFYSANNHPLHGIFCCSPDHPLSRPERMAIEIVTVLFSYFTLWLAERQGEQSFLEAFIFSFLYVTLPGIILWWMLFLLFTCPKLGIVDEAMSSKSDIKRAYRWRFAGATLGYVLLVCIFVCVLALCAIKDLGFWTKALMVVRGRAKGYIIFWFLQIFFYFNPVVAWGQPGGEATTLGFIGDCVGLGQWRIERQRFQSICASALQEWEKRMHREQLLRDRNLWMKPRSVFWEYEIRGGYKTYDNDCSDFLERKYQRFLAGGKSSVKVKTSGMWLTVDFQAMNQTALLKVRNIRRRED
jgi:hypothetical protein